MQSFHYELITRSRHGHERVEHGYASEQPLREGDLVTLRGDRWIIARVEERPEAEQPRAVAEPARYRLDLRHEDGSEEAGAFRRFRTNGPGLGHAFTTRMEGKPVSWQVTQDRFARDDAGHPYIEFVAERDYGEGDQDEIEEWDSGDTRVFASVGRWEDEAAPDKGHGWMVRLVDASALGAAGFHRVRKVDL